MPLIGTMGSEPARSYGLNSRSKLFISRSFTTVGSNTFTPPDGTGNVELLVVGGGGPGGSGFDRTGGAGGGGGLIYNASYPVTPNQSIGLTVGTGGVVNGLSLPSLGGNSTFGGLTAYGGGYGGASAFPLQINNVAGSVYNRQITNVAFTYSSTTITATIPSQITLNGVTFTYNSTTKLVTATTSGAHGLAFGNRITLSGTTASTNPPNGTWIVSNIISTTQFNFHISTNNEPTGTISSGTVQTDSAHGLLVGQKFTVAGTTASTNPPNNIANNYSTNVLGTYFTIATVPTSNTFTFIAASTPTGTITNGTVALPDVTLITAYSNNYGTAAIHNATVGAYLDIVGSSTSNLSNLDGPTNQQFFTGMTFTNTQLYGCTITNAGNIITITSSTPHGFNIGDTFTVYNSTATTNPPNETGTVLTTPTPYQWTWQATSIPTGTISNGDVMGCLINASTLSATPLTLNADYSQSINIASTTSVQNPPIGNYFIKSLTSSTNFTYIVPNGPYNPKFTGVTFTNSGTTITGTTSVAHGLSTGQYIQISGTTASTNAPNGYFYLASASGTTFTYTVTSAPTGTITSGTLQSLIGNTSSATTNMYTPNYQYYFRNSWPITATPTPTALTLTVNPAPNGAITSGGTIGVPPSNGASAGAGGHNNSGKNGLFTTGIAGQGNGSGDGFDSSFGIFASGGGGGAGSFGGNGGDQGGGSAGPGLTYFGTMYGSGGAGSVQTLLGGGSAVSASSSTWSGSTVTINTASAHGLSSGSIVRFEQTNMTDVAISSVSYSGTSITVNTSSPHGLSASGSVYVYGTTASTNPPNGRYTVASTPSSTQFTYIANATPTGTVSGGTLLMSGQNAPLGNFSVVTVPTSTSFTVTNTGGLTPIGTAMNSIVIYGALTGVAPTFTYSGTKITVTCPSAHGIQYAGQSIGVYAVTSSGSNAPNGLWRVSRIISATVFQYIVSNAPTGTLSNGFWMTPASYIHSGSNQESSIGGLLPGTQYSGGGTGAVSFLVDGLTSYFNGGAGTNGTGGGGGAPAYQYPNATVVSPVGGNGGSGAIVVRYYAWS